MLVSIIKIIAPYVTTIVLAMIKRKRDLKDIESGKKTVKDGQLKEAATE